MDVDALSIYQNQSPKQAIEAVTKFSVDLGNQLVVDWNSFFGYLFVRYRDGYKISSNNENLSCGCTSASAGYPRSWYDRIATDTGDHYLDLGTSVAAGNIDPLKDGSTSFTSVSKYKIVGR